MAPPKSRPAAADDSPNLASQKSHVAHVQLGGHANGKKRAAAANGNGVAAGGSHLRDVTALEDAADRDRSAEEMGGEINFPALPTPLLATYRHAHRLNTPAAFTSPYHELLLTRPGGIGKMSPTMAKVRGKRRVGKEHLALAVRKNFKERSVVEAEAAAWFLYAVRHRDEKFKMVFAPAKTR